jgi:hypothetical protein
VVNYPSEDVPYTRITEYKHLTGQTHRKTSISYEFPCGEGDPYYPVPRAANQELYRKYLALAQKTPTVEFVGRLATYRYYNMDQVVAQALTTYDKLHGTRWGYVQSAAVGPSVQAHERRANGQDTRDSSFDRRVNDRARRTNANGHDAAVELRDYI